MLFYCSALYEELEHYKALYERTCETRQEYMDKYFDAEKRIDSLTAEIKYLRKKLNEQTAYKIRAFST